MHSKTAIFIALLAVLAIYTQSSTLPLITALRSSSLAKAFKNNLRPLIQRSSFMSTTATTTAAASSTFRGLPVIPPNDPSLTVAPNASIPRKIKLHFEAREQAEGAGATVRRSVGTPKLRNLSPFLMLDDASVEPGAGFPDHPHRGQETITYLINGAIDHEDFAGNKGTISTGDLQFMTAGRGIVHAEIPRHDADGTPVRGLQLWVDLPQKLKMCEPRYRDLRAAEIPTVDLDDGKVNVKVISGQSHGVDSLQELAYTPVWLLDVTVRPGGKISQAVPAGWNTFVYILKGAATFNSGAEKKWIPTYHNVVFEQKGDTIVAEVEESAEEEARFIIVSGIPLDQTVVQYGPFVLNTKEEIYQAMSDYQSFSNGFERAKGWQSEIGKTLM